MKTRFAQSVLDRPARLAVPIGVYAGLEIVGGSVSEAVSRADVQTEAALALRERFGTSVLMTAMDLSAEAEAFGCEVRMSNAEIPTVVGRAVTTLAGIRALALPEPGEARTSVHLEASRRLVKEAGATSVLGCMIGPFSLAGRIFGVSEALEATALDPGPLLELLDKVTAFQSAYARAFRETGVSGVIIAEPAAGLLSPAGLGRFSAPFVKRIVAESETAGFGVVLHNCGARLVHLDKTLESGAEIYHFGSPMDVVGALDQVSGRVILGGNLDPAAVFYNGTPDSVRAATLKLLDATKAHRAFIPSSGCDIPPGTPKDNIAAFTSAVAAFNASEG